MTVVSKRTARKEEKRARLRDAAWELFSTKGFEATTTKEIAARAGVASGTLFLYARDKADLLFLVLHDRLSHAVDEGMRTLPTDASLLEQCMHLFAGFFRVYAEAPGVARAFVKELPGADGPNAVQTNALTMALLTHLSALVQRAQARGEIAADVPPMLLAHNVFGLYFVALTAWLSNTTTLEGALDPLLRSSLALQLRGLGPRRTHSTV
ncbi:MAG: TetR/AcrR family transcriptional regulator [Polyangiaceae bacterium]|nr:TetR/AcrR family transcriptional regulator [Polyangiaceae bacterium]